MEIVNTSDKDHSVRYVLLSRLYPEDYEPPTNHRSMTSYFESCSKWAEIIANFYTTNQGSMVRPTTPFSAMPLIESHNTYIIEVENDPGQKRHFEISGDRLLVCSMNFHIDLPIRRPEGLVIEKFVETGATISIQGGYGHQVTTASARLINILLHDHDRIPFGVVNAENFASLRNVPKINYDPVKEIVPELTLFKQYSLNLDCDLVWLRPSVGTICAAADRIADLRRNPVRHRANPKGGNDDVIHFAFGRGFDERFFDAVERISTERPVTIKELSNIMHGDAFHFRDDLLVP